MEEPKTRSFVEMLENLGIASEKSLFLVKDRDENTLKSSRNIPYSHLKQVSDATTYDVLNADTLVITQDALKELEELFKA